MKISCTIEYFKRLYGIEKIQILKTDLDKSVDTIAGKIFIPPHLDFAKQIYITKISLDHFSLSNYEKYHYSLIKKGIQFLEVSEGIFKIDRYIKLDLFCDLHGFKDVVFNKLINCQGDFISISEISYTFLLHPFIENKETIIDLSRLNICEIDRLEDLESFYYIFPEEFKIELPTNIEKIQKAISEFKPSKYGNYDYFENNFSDNIKYNSVYQGSTYQDVVLRTYSLEYLFFCITNMQKYNFNLESKLIGSFSLNDFHAVAQYDSSKHTLEAFKTLSLLKGNDSVSLIEYLELKRDDLIQSGEPVDLFDEKVLETLKKEFKKANRFFK